MRRLTSRRGQPPLALSLRSRGSRHESAVAQLSTLGGMATDSQVDDAVIAYLATTNGCWRKVAMVFARVTEALGAELPEGHSGHVLFGSRNFSERWTISCRR